jgi:D-3-phosphoglycerate dehydrogenase
MEVIGVDPIVSASDARAMGVEPVTFDEIFPRAEVLSLHAPVLPETKGMVGAAQLARMPRGAVLVNAARGALVDEAALVEALRSGQLAGAALDVYAEEPPKGSPLLSLPNVVLTPHIGAATVEAQEAVGEEIAKMLLARMASG